MCRSQATCSDCAQGSYSNDARTGCNACPPRGQVPALLGKDQWQCLLCPRTYFQKPGTQTCEKCPDHFESEDDQSGCKASFVFASFDLCV